MRCSHKLSKIILVSAATLFTLSLGNAALSSYTHNASADNIDDEMNNVDRETEQENRADDDMVANNEIIENKDKPYNVINPSDSYSLYQNYKDYTSYNHNRKIINSFKQNIKHDLLVGDYDKKTARKVSRTLHFYPTKRMMRKAQQKEKRIRHNAWIHRPYYDLYGRPYKPSISKLAKGIIQIESSEPSKLSYKQYLNIRNYGHIKRNDPHYNYTLGAFQSGSWSSVNTRSLNIYAKNVFNKAYTDGFLTDFIYQDYSNKLTDSNTYPKKPLRKGQSLIKLLKRYYRGNKMFKRGFIKGNSYKHAHKQLRYRNNHQYNLGFNAGRSLARLY